MAPLSHWHEIVTIDGAAGKLSGRGAVRRLGGWAVERIGGWIGRFARLLVCATPPFSGALPGFGDLCRLHLLGEFFEGAGCAR